MTPPTKWLFFPTQSSGTTTWRDEADHSFEATVHTSWSTSSLAPGMIGYDQSLNSGSGGYTYNITINGDLEPSNATCAYGNIAVGGDLVWWVTSWVSAYTTIGIDFRNHPDSTQSSTGSEQTAMSHVLTANSNYDWVCEAERSDGTIAMLKRYNDTGSTYDPDWGANAGSHYYWNSSPKCTASDYSVGFKVRFYWFDDATTIQDSNWPPTQVT